MSAARPTPRRAARENRTRYVVLGMLTLRPMSGYALRGWIAKSVGHFWQESYGQLYPALRALAAEGLVERVAPRPRGRGGAPYAITPRGRAALAAWLAQPPVMPPARNELLLKVFFAGAVPAEVTLRNLAAVEEGLRGHLGALEGLAAGWQEASEGHPDARYWRLTLDCGLLLMKAMLAWLDDARRVVAARGGEAPRPATRRSGKARAGGKA